MKSKICDMQTCLFSKIAIFCSRWRIGRKIFLPILLKVEGGEWYSVSWRRILSLYYGIEIGDYSYGIGSTGIDCPAGTRIGKYVSIGPGVKIYLRNHPLDRVSMHPFFYNEKLGFVNKDNILGSSLTIGHDVWIGGQVIITPSCNKIGVGAVVGAGAVVTKDVPAFSVVTGNPASIIRYRFDSDCQKKIMESCWWENSITELSFDMRNMIVPFVG